MFAYLTSYFYSIWNSIVGPLLMLSSHPHQSGRLLVLGLDNAGKTTLLQAIRRLDNSNHSSSNNNSRSSSSSNSSISNNHHLRSYPPTDRPEHIKNIVTIQNQITFHAYDLGGHEAVRHLWSDYYNTDSTSGGNGTSGGTCGNGDSRYNDSTDTIPTTTTTTTSSNHNNLAILFCIDIADRQRIEEAAYELDALIHDGLNAGNHNSTHNNNHQENHNNNNYNTTKYGIPIAILLTKCDDMHEDHITTIANTSNTNNNNNNNNNTSSPPPPPPLMTLPQVCDYIDYPSLCNSHNGPMHICTISVYKNTGYIEALQWITQTLVAQQEQR